jgi:hypothetical protein
MTISLLTLVKIDRNELQQVEMTECEKFNLSELLITPIHS